MFYCKGEEDMKYRIEQQMDLREKLGILADAAKYDVACTSSGVERKNTASRRGSATASVLTADAFPF